MPANETMPRACRSKAIANAFAVIPISDAIARPVTDSVRNRTEYTGIEASVISVVATIGVSVLPEA